MGAGAMLPADVHLALIEEISALKQVDFRPLGSGIAALEAVQAAHWKTVPVRLCSSPVRWFVSGKACQRPIAVGT